MGSVARLSPSSSSPGAYKYRTCILEGSRGSHNPNGRPRGRRKPGEQVFHFFLMVSVGDIPKSILCVAFISGTTAGSCRSHSVERSWRPDSKYNNSWASTRRWLKRALFSSPDPLFMRRHNGNGSHELFPLRHLKDGWPGQWVVLIVRDAFKN